MTATTRLDVLRKLLDMSMQQAAIGAAIKRARLAKRMTQRQVAAQIPGRDGMPVDDQTVSRWERGRHTPDIETLQLIAEILGKPVSYFVADDVVVLDPPRDGQAVPSTAETQTILRELRRDLADQAQAVATVLAAQERIEDTLGQVLRAVAPTRRTKPQREQG